jgi:hypothetical protein
VLEFRWNRANIEHIELHNITPEQAEYVVKHTRRPYPEKRENGKFFVAGRTQEGTYIYPGSICYRPAASRLCDTRAAA